MNVQANNNNNFMFRQRLSKMQGHGRSLEVNRHAERVLALSLARKGEEDQGVIESQDLEEEEEKKCDGLKEDTDTDRIVEKQKDEAKLPAVTPTNLNLVILDEQETVQPPPALVEVPTALEDLDEELPPALEDFNEPPSPPALKSCPDEEEPPC